jgi:hypothetical protein
MNALLKIYLRNIKLASVPEGRMSVAEAFMPRTKEIFHYVAQRRDDFFSTYQPGDKSSGYPHAVPPGRLKSNAKF